MKSKKTKSRIFHVLPRGKKATFGERKVSGFPRIARKKASKLVTDEPLEVILAGAGIVLLIILFISLYNMASYNVNEEAAKGYFKTLKNAIEKTGEGEQEFLTWQGDFYVLYFGNYKTFDSTGHHFSLDKAYKNYICVCYTENDDNQGKCMEDACMSLDLGADYSTEDSYGRWIIEKNTKVKIKKQDGRYVFFT